MTYHLKKHVENGNRFDFLLQLQEVTENTFKNAKLKCVQATAMWDSVHSFAVNMSVCS